MSDAPFYLLPNKVTVIGNSYVFGIDDLSGTPETKGVTWATIKANLNLGDLNNVTINEIDSSSGAITRLLAKVSDSSGSYWTDLSLDEIGIGGGAGTITGAENLIDSSSGGAVGVYHSEESNGTLLFKAIGAGSNKISISENSAGLISIDADPSKINLDDLGDVDITENSSSSFITKVLAKINDSSGSHWIDATLEELGIGTAVSLNDLNDVDLVEDSSSSYAPRILAQLTEDSSQAVWTNAPLSAISHNLFSNLAVGDVHTQYAILTGARAFTGQVTFLTPDSSNDEAPIHLPIGIDITSPVNGDLWNDGTHLYFRSGGANVDLLSPGGSMVLDDLSDVTISADSSSAWAPRFLAKITEDSSGSYWKDATAEELGLTLIYGLDDVPDVVLSSPADGELLVFNVQDSSSGSGIWENKTLVEAGIIIGGENIGDSSAETAFGVFHSENNGILRFKRIGTGSTKLSISESSNEEELTFDVVPANINIGDLGDVTIGADSSSSYAIRLLGKQTEDSSGAIWEDLPINIIEHDMISGLADDDHTQYILVSGGRAFTGKQTFVTVDSAHDDGQANFPSGDDPTSPNEGDLWYNGTALNFESGVGTVNLLSPGGAIVLGDIADVDLVEDSSSSYAPRLLAQLTEDSSGAKWTNAPLSAISHNLFSNLTVGDVHTQYMPVAATRAFTDKVTFVAADSSLDDAQINFPVSVDPSSPTEGDLFYNGVNLYFKPSGALVDLLSYTNPAFDDLSDVEIDSSLNDLSLIVFNGQDSSSGAGLWQNQSIDNFISNTLFANPMPQSTGPFLEWKLDDDNYSGLIEEGRAYENLTYGECVYKRFVGAIGNDSSGESFEWALAASDDESTIYGKLGICVQAASEGDLTKILLYGNVRAETAMPGFASSGPMYVRTTPGQIGSYESGNYKRCVGFTHDDTTLFFNPESDYTPPDEVLSDLELGDLNDVSIGADSSIGWSPRVLAKETEDSSGAVWKDMDMVSLLTALFANTLSENVSLQFDNSLSADGKYSGITESATAGATLAFGDLVYLQTSDGRWELADADAEATASNRLGICVLAAAGDGSATKILTYGFVRADTAFPTLTVGAPCFVGLTAGDIVTDIDSSYGTGDIVRIVGHGHDANTLFFNPENTYIEF